MYISDFANPFWISEQSNFSREEKMSFGISLAVGQHNLFVSYICTSLGVVYVSFSC